MRKTSVRSAASSWGDLDALNGNRHVRHGLYGRWAIPTKFYYTWNHCRRRKSLLISAGLLVDQCRYLGYTRNNGQAPSARVSPDCRPRREPAPLWYATTLTHL